MKKLTLPLLIVLVIGAFYFSVLKNTAPKNTIKIGVIHSLSGSLASSEQGMMQATLLAIDEINKSGGILGMNIEPVTADGASDPKIFKKEAQRLILEKDVSAIFGCLTSASRKAVRSVVEQHQSMLFYPLFYEGLEHSPNIIYMGATPNQSLTPAVQWAFENIGPKFAIIGSDSIFSRALSAIIQDHLYAINAELTADIYLDAETPNFGLIEKQLSRNKPDVILSTQGNVLNNSLFEGLKSMGKSYKNIPTFIFGMDSIKKTRKMAGRYVLWNYFDDVDYIKNKTFFDAYKRKYGKDSEISEPMELAYLGVHLWAKAARQARSYQPGDVLKAIPNQSITSSSGLIYICPESQHAYHNITIGRIASNGEYELVWESQNPIKPMPYPIFRARQKWDELVCDLIQRFE